MGSAGAAPSCRQAAWLAEQRWSLPRNLLLAIGEVETGRPDPVDGTPQPWPWTADVAGQDYVFASQAEAVAVVGFLQQRGIASIDVGCFQINLHFHPAAFASVADGFDVGANANYAAFFLRSLFLRSGSWDSAVAAYHSADPVLGETYRRHVLHAWQRLGMAPMPLPAGDPYVILGTAVTWRIPVYSAATLPAGLRAALGLPPRATGTKK